jgi:integrase
LSRVLQNKPDKEAKPTTTTAITCDNGQDPLTIFKYALKSSESQRQYPGRLKVFLDYLGLEGTIDEQARDLTKKARNSPQWLQDCLMKFIVYQKERVTRKEISEGTIGNYYKATKLFCEMNFDQPIVNWKKVARGMPRARKFALDRIPTMEEIRKLCEYPDRRIKAVIYTMASSGIRVGAFNYLQWKHISPISNSNGDFIAAQMLIYPGDPTEEYYTFCTPEAYNELRNWMQYREDCGEKISGESWVMRDIWQTHGMDYGAKFGLAENPKKLDAIAVKRIIERGLWEQGIRKPLPEGTKHHEWKPAHGFRKFFKTKAEQVMLPLHVEMLLGHDTGLSRSYYRPSTKTLLEDYLKAVDLLTINVDRIILQKQVAELTEKGKEENYIIKGKLSEKDEEIRSMKEELSSMRAEMNDVLEVLKIAKSKNGMIGKNRTMLDEDRNISFCEDYEDGQTRVVKIPIDRVQIEEVQTSSVHK